MKTAVEWLVEEIKDLIPNDIGSQLKFKNKVKKAKAMEKEQIIETWHNGYNNQSPMIDEENCGQQYYNETFKSE